MFSKEYLLVESVRGEAIRVQTETYLNHFFNEFASSQDYHITVIERQMVDDKIVAQQTICKVAQNVPLDIREW